MTVSDETAGGSDKPRDWFAIRREYETTVISQRDLADKHGIPQSTMMKRAMREKWKQGAKLVRATVLELEARADDMAKEKMSRDLAPWIEQAKTEVTKRGFAIGEKGMSRVEEAWNVIKPSDGKDEANFARAAETFLRMARTSLGMNDSSAGPQPLSLTILTNQAAVAVNAPQV